MYVLRMTASARLAVVVEQILGSNGAFQETGIFPMRKGISPLRFFFRVLKTFPTRRDKGVECLFMYDGDDCD